MKENNLEMSGVNSLRKNNNYEMAQRISWTNQLQMV